MTARKKPEKPAAPAAAPVLTRDQILAADDLHRVRVHVPLWKGDVFVRAMSGRERDAWEVLAFTVDENGVEANVENVRARLLALTICDEAGELLFTVDDIEALGEKASKALETLFTVSQQVNAVSTADIEELAGN